MSDRGREEEEVSNLLGETRILFRWQSSFRQWHRKCFNLFPFQPQTNCEYLGGCCLTVGEYPFAN